MGSTLGEALLRRRPVLRAAAAGCAAVLALTTCAIATPSAAEAESGRTARVHPIRLQVDGEPATGIVVYPARRDGTPLQPQALLTFAHGHGEDADDFEPQLRRIVSHTGAAAIAMDFRGPHGAFNLWAGYRDTVSATHWLQRRYPAVERSVIWGWSMGGAVSGMSAAYAPDTYDAWVATFPLVNSVGAWTLFKLIEPDSLAELEADAGCAMPDCPDEYVARSPSLIADRMRLEQAVLLHAIDDQRVPIEQSREMQAALTATEIPTAMYTFGHGGHGRGPVGDASEDAVERVLLGTEPDEQPAYEYFVP